MHEEPCLLSCWLWQRFLIDLDSLKKQEPLKETRIGNKTQHKQSYLVTDVTG